MLCNTIFENPQKGFLQSIAGSGPRGMNKIKKRIFFQTLRHSSFLLPSVMEFYYHPFRRFLGHPNVQCTLYIWVTENREHFFNQLAMIKQFIYLFKFALINYCKIGTYIFLNICVRFNSYRHQNCNFSVYSQFCFSFNVEGFFLRPNFCKRRSTLQLILFH